MFLKRERKSLVEVSFKINNYSYRLFFFTSTLNIYQYYLKLKFSFSPAAKQASLGKANYSLLAAVLSKHSSSQTETLPALY